MSAAHSIAQCGIFTLSARSTLIDVGMDDVSKIGGRLRTAKSFFVKGDRDGDDLLSAVEVRRSRIYFGYALCARC